MDLCGFLLFFLFLTFAAISPVTQAGNVDTYCWPEEGYKIASYTHQVFMPDECYYFQNGYSYSTNYTVQSYDQNPDYIVDFGSILCQSGANLVVGNPPTYQFQNVEYTDNFPHSNQEIRSPEWYMFQPAMRVYCKLGLTCQIAISVCVQVYKEQVCLAA